jgi:hypothetical protein
MLLKTVFRDLFNSRARRAPPSLSVIINFYNNVREARNALYSLTRAYQRGAQDIPYEVIAIDNGSPKPLSDAYVQAFGPEFQYRFVATKSVSPVKAINDACRDAIGDQLLVIIDGAHILSPGILKLTREAFERFPSPFVATVPFHIGPQMQNLSVPLGYNQQVEDRLLDESGWKENGYRLYSVSAAFADGSGGWYGQLFESGCFAIRKDEFLRLGGYDERFQSRGGGLASLDLFQRALATPELTYVMLLGEGTFHQVHGGVATNAPVHDHPWKAFHHEYRQIRGHSFFRVPREPVFLGTVPGEASRLAALSRRLSAEVWRKHPAVPAIREDKAS